MTAFFVAASKTILSYSEQRHFRPAIICALHTFGRNLKFNPHIHLLSTCGGLLIKNNQVRKKWKHSPYLPFVMLRKRWQYLLINELKKSIRNYLKKNTNCGELSVFSHPGVLDSFFNPLLEIDWYVHDSEELDYENFTVSYIGRYTKRPPLGESRILHVGCITQAEGVWVTFSYKERNQYPVKLSVPVDRFIELLIQHILPDNFRQIRYYGILANRVKTPLKKIFLKLLKRKKYFLDVLPWRERQKLYRNFDPLLCSKCKKQMKLAEIAIFKPKENSLKVYHPP
ncbi:MAG: transposase [Elusimicrobia bacterium]|nr:transposase [Elusimicrobiota bacterium]